ncbi:cellulase family glycosylhydrolase [Bacillus sp. ISL-75]|uniref:family 1 glycosylhydrolase n=1 Tax=Bacillus sp. ISL-75 TaxID=2819137 RepID=UPI001BE5373B|nr:family 1 glycosylhydrolase [Bacillus sp. ISL-75]MBT2726358.1 cellulase family glycosylhydrolase [Bacillus sp. ISL-75]
MGKLSRIAKKTILFTSVLSFSLLALTGCKDKAMTKTFNNDQFGVNIHFTGNQPTDIELIKSAGLRVVRTDLTWSRIEREKGKYDFITTGYDELTNSLIKNNIRPYYILDYSNSLYEKDLSIVTNDGREAFNKYVDSVTKRYSGNSIVWEIWNEPNGFYWKPNPNVEAYSQLVKGASKIIKRNDPSAQVVAPALTGLNSDSIVWLEEVFKRGAMEDVDAVSVHPYRGAPPETVVNDYQLLRKMISKYTKKDMPIVSGEWGYSTTHGWSGQDLNENKQAEYLVRMFLINEYKGIPISIWYDWKNDGQDPNNAEHNFGILWGDNNPKPAYQALKTLTHTLNGYHFNKRLEFGQPKDYIFKFTNTAGQKVLAFWTIEANHYLTISLPSSKGELVSMLGETQTVKWNTNQVTLSLSSSPNYLIIE